MNEEAEPRAARWKLYLPGIILILGVAATVATWRAIKIHESEEIGWATQLAADAIRTDLREDMEWQRIGLDRLALLWEAADPGQDLWINNAELYIQHRPGCLAVEWIGVKGDKRLFVSQSRITPMLIFNGVPKAAMDIAAGTGSTVFSETRVAGDGTAQWAVVHAVFAKDKLRGYVVSFFDSKRAIEDNLGDVGGLGFSFAVVADQQEFTLSQVNREYEQRWAMTSEVPLPGVKWHVRVWPNPSIMHRIRSILPDMTMGVGLVLSLLAFLTLYFAARVARSSSRIELANAALQREIAVREGAEKELRRAHDELDERVQARTVELTTANVLLRQEIAGHERAEDSLRELTGRLFYLRDEEQRRLARELHDGATQTLIALAMNLAFIQDAIPSNDSSAKTLVSDSARLLKQCTEELRTISYLLHPPLLSDLGLSSALQDFTEGFAARSGINVTLNIDPALGRFRQQLELTVFRVVQEALSNVHRHAQSRTAAISLEQHSTFLHLEISDAGRGIPPEVLASTNSKLAGLGIAGMRERVRLLGGQLEIHSGTTGTKIEVLLPLAAPDSLAKKVGAEPSGRLIGPIAAA